jgi:hypothetical protein
MLARSAAPGINRLINAMKKVPALAAVAEMATGAALDSWQKSILIEKATLD